MIILDPVFVMMTETVIKLHYPPAFDNILDKGFAIWVLQYEKETFSKEKNILMCKPKIEFSKVVK